MKKILTSGICLATFVIASGAYADEVNTNNSSGKDEPIIVIGKRANRISKGATGLALDIKETPQSISVVSKEQINDFGISGSNDALRLGTGVLVDQYETNRATYNSRGFDIQLTQIDGVGMTNDWGTVSGQQDAYMFDKIELIRGANGLLTGVGNASGTINYVRKRPTNNDGGEFILSGGSYDLKRASIDYNKVLNSDGTWAARIVAVTEDKDSYLRALTNDRTSVYGVIDGQIGEKGVLTLGYNYQKSHQNSPMWGSLTLNYLDGTMANFDVSSSASQDWTFWDNTTQTAFAEYTYKFSPDWEGKITYNHRQSTDYDHLLYAYTLGGGLNPDNTGLYGWPYGSYVKVENNLVDASINGKFELFGRENNLIAGINRSEQKTATYLYPFDAKYSFLPLPAFPYAGNVYPEPVWGARTYNSGGEQTLTRLYAASRLSLTDNLKAIIGVNAIKLERSGSSLYGNLAAAVDYPDTKKISPYFGLTYDFAGNSTAYFSYSDIFQNQDQTDYYNKYLDPMKGVNYEIGVKSTWLNNKLLTTLALFTAEQDGLATYAGVNNQNMDYYVPKDVKSKGVEIEAIGKISKNTNLTLGATHLELTGPDGHSTYEWIPRTTINFMLDTRLAAMPKLKLGLGGKWQSDIYKIGGARQDAYIYVNGFATYDLTDKANIRLNINNIFDKKYLNTVQFGGYYAAPRNVAVSFGYKF